jgi:hypothetical protein
VAAAANEPYKADLLGKIEGISGAAITKGQKLMSDAQARLIPTTTATEAAASGVIANQTVTVADKIIEVWKLGA